jgi:hypothetical protein
LYATTRFTLRHIKAKHGIVLLSILLIVLLTATTNSVKAQKSVLFQWSNFLKVPKYAQAYLTFKHESGYGVVIKLNQNLRINLFDSQLKFIGSKSLDMIKAKESMIDIHYFKNAVYVLTQVDITNQRQVLRVRIIKTDSLKEPDRYTDLINLRENRFNREINFHVIPISTGIHVWHIVPPEFDDSYQSIEYTTFDFEFKKIDHAVIDIPVKNDLCEILKIELTDKKQFLIYTKEYAVRPVEKRGFLPNYKFVFYVADPGINKLKQCEFNNKNIYPERGRMKWTDGVFEATGLFSEKTDGLKPGYWYLKYDFITSKYLIDTIHYFGKQVKDLPNNGFKYSISRRSSLETMFLDYFIRDKLNNKIIVAEQYYLMPATFGSTYTYNRFYGDILLLFLDSTSKVYTAKRLIKAQQTFNNFGEYSSYYLERKDSVLRFFYNDHTANRKLKKNKAQHLVWHKHANLCIITVTPNMLKTYYLANYKQSDGILQIRDMLEISNNKYLVYARKGKKAKLGIMELIEND